MTYSLVDWSIDARNTGRCLNCRMTLDHHGEALQCYGCGKWIYGSSIGDARVKMVELSTSCIQQNKRRERSSETQTHEGQQFEDRLFKKPQAPKGPEAPKKPGS